MYTENTDFNERTIRSDEPPTGLNKALSRLVAFFFFLLSDLLTTLGEVGLFCGICSYQTLTSSRTPERQLVVKVQPR